jgi:hypothetical protein
MLRNGNAKGISPAELVSTDPKRNQRFLWISMRMSEKSGGLFTQNKQTVPGVSICIKDSKKKE